MTLVTEVTVQLRSEEAIPIWTYSHVEAVPFEESGADLLVSALAILERRNREAIEAVKAQAAPELKEARK